MHGIKLWLAMPAKENFYTQICVQMSQIYVGSYSPYVENKNYTDQLPGQ